jgi:hypothetical protein
LIKSEAICKESITVASLCHYIFRTYLMKSLTIAIMPVKGYNAEQRTSLKCIKWLKYQSFKNNIFIQHAKNDGEKILVITF